MTDAAGTTNSRPLTLDPGTVLVMHAHPDDEVFATGAAIMHAKATGNRVILRLLTGGEGRSAPLQPDGLREARRRRARQLDESAAQLGIDEWAQVDEGRWVDTPHDPPRTIAGAPPHQLEAAIADVLEAVQPTTVLTVGPDGLTGHPDHIACARAVATATRRASMDSGHVLGATLHVDVIEAARRHARSAGAKVGPARVTGVRADVLDVVTGPACTERRRRAALDAYAPGLGTGSVDQLLRAYPHTSDSLLMRLVLDERGWDRDTFLRRDDH